MQERIKNTRSIVVSSLVAMGLLWIIVAVPQIQINKDIRDGFVVRTMVPATVNEYRKTLIQTVGGLVVFLGLYLTWRRIRATEGQLTVSEEGLITERFSRAIEQLGNDNTAIKLGGIYALERIAHDSEADHPVVMEVLAAYVRHHAPIPIYEEHVREEKKPPIEIQAILTVLGRRKVAYDKDRIDLRRTHLRDVDLKHANLDRMYLQGADLFNADFRGASLEDTNLTKARLFGAILTNANLKGAKLRGANLRLANLQNAILDEAVLSLADLQDANFEMEQLMKADGLGSIQPSSLRRLLSQEAWEESV